MDRLDQTTLEEIERAVRAADTPQQRIAAALSLGGERAAIGTSGQITGAVSLAMAVETGHSPRIFSIDTLRLFPETYELMKELEARYGIHVEWYRPDADELSKMVRNHGEFLFFDSKAKQEYCCDVRKVHPNEKALETVDVWLTGLRRDQSDAREDVEMVSWVPALDRNGNRREILKVAPLVDWDESMLRMYIAAHDVPTHKLLRNAGGPWRYESIGCTICTTPISANEPRRAGRWRWFNSLDDEDKKECGIHLNFEPVNHEQTKP